MKVKLVARWLAVLAAVGALAYTGYYAYYSLLVPKQLGSESSIFTIESGEHLDRIASNLQRQGYIRSDTMLSLYARMQGYAGRLQAGQYVLGGSLSAVQILEKIVSGDAVFDEVVITVPEGWTIQRIGSYVEERGLFAEAAFEEAATMQPRYRDLWVLQELEDGTSLEGYLFPDTYRVFSDSTPNSLVRKMVKNLQSHATRGLLDEAQEQDRTLHDVLTLASIVQREAPEEDMKAIAGVFWKRLQETRYLESDATINYILGTSKLQPTFDDTDVDHPYNTYQNFGLPPGPIGNPGMKAIQAALHPGDNPYYFFLHKPSGETVFSETFSEHLRKKARYLD